MRRQIARVWIKRRARRLQRFFQVDISTAVAEATLDWYRFMGQPLPQKMNPLTDEVTV